MSRTRPSRWVPGIASALSLAVSAGPAVSADEEPPVQKPSEARVHDALDESRAVQREGNVAGVASQERIDEISDETDRLFARYSSVLSQMDSTRVYNRQMEELVASQEDELASLAVQLEQVEEVGRSVTPLMLRMVASLKAFIKLDVPFLIEERTARVRGLREMMNRADVTNAEKFRRIMEVFQIESEFGRTIDTYRATMIGTSGWVSATSGKHHSDNYDRVRESGPTSGRFQRVGRARGELRLACLAAISGSAASADAGVARGAETGADART